MPRNKRTVLILATILLLGSVMFAGGPKQRVPIDPSALKPYADGEVLIKFKKGFNLAAVKNFAASQSLEVKKRFKGLSRAKGQECALLYSPGKADTMVLVNALKKSPNVEFVSPNYRREIAAIPNDTYFSSLWGMHNSGQTIGGVAGIIDADIDAPEAWCVSKGSSSVIVAVIDTGFDYTHPDLAANAWTNPGEIPGNGLDDDGNGYDDDVYGIDPAGVDGSGTSDDTDPMDGYGHGTHCAGTIGAVGNNALGVVGVNWNVKIMGLKFFDDLGENGYDAFSIECIGYAVDEKQLHGQNVVAINASWGGTGGDDSGLLRDAIEAANNAGIVFCAAAGNGGDDGIGDNNETTHHYPSDYTLAGIISVAATDNRDGLASFSNYGATSIDLGAPGVSILSTVPGKYIPQAGDIFFDNMEGGAGNWVTGGTKNTWAISTDQEIFANPNFPVPSPTHFWSDSPSANYQNGTDSWLAYNTNINLSGYVGQNVYFGIGSAMYIQETRDHAYVQFSNNGGSTWTTIFDFTGYAYYWSSYVWLIPDSFKTTQFRMRFRLTSNNSTNYQGWLIDNIGIGTAITYSYESWDGTSMATPHVAGAVGLIASVLPSETVIQRKARILNWGDAKASLAGKTVSGRRLNLYNSLTASLTPTPQSIAVTAPNGGESWTAGTSQNITWSSAGTYPVGSVNIDYSVNNGSSWTSVVTATANDGSFSWTVPDTPSANCRVRVWEIDGCPSDVSNAVFTIAAAVLETVSAPTTPTGPASGTTGSSYSYVSGGSVSSLGHDVQYLIEWGDSSDSGWLAEGITQASHSWATAGTYNVRAMARCADHTGIMSSWSTALSVTISTPTGGYYNSPAQRLILIEVNQTTGWMSAVQITDVSGGSTVQVYYNSGTNRRGPFTLWTNTGGPGSSVSFINILQVIDNLDSGAFTYMGTSGALEFITQDGSHLIQAAVRTFSGNTSRTFPAFADVETNTAALGRELLIPNISNDATYRPSVVLFNPGTESVTTEVRLVGSDGSQIGSTVTQILAAYEMAGVAGMRDNTYSNANVVITVTSASGRLLASGQTAHNVSNDPAAHLAVQLGASYANSPAQRLILTEVNQTTGWMSAVQITDVSGGSTVQVYYNSGTNRRGPFTLWTNTGGPGSSVSFINILQVIDNLDSGAFTYLGTSGALEFITQDGSHLIQAAVRTFSNNTSRTFPAFADVEANTAALGRELLIPNISNDATYRPSVVLFNPGTESVTTEVRLVGSDGSQIGSTVTQILAAYEMAGVAGMRDNTYSNANVVITVTSASGRVLASGQTANNVSNDPAAHIAVQAQ